MNIIKVKTQNSESSLKAFCKEVARSINVTFLLPSPGKPKGKMC
jgi:hypothetical protein